MKLFWLSPWGDGWSIAAKIRDAGNKVVYYCPDVNNKNGLGYLPTASEANWESLANKSDLVVCDGVSPSRRTRRSWCPSDTVQRLTTLKKRGVPYIGPVPTTELLTNDERYRQKILSKFVLTAPTGIGGPVFVISFAPNRTTHIVLRHRELWGMENGPDTGNLGDVVIPIDSKSQLSQRFNKLVEFLHSLQHSSYINIHCETTESKIGVTAITSGFLYPSIFAQLPDLLNVIAGRDDGPSPEVRLAVSLLDMNGDTDTSTDHLLSHDGFFGGEIHRDPETGVSRGHGAFLGALAGTGSWPLVQNKVNEHLQSLVRGDWGFRPNIGDNATHVIQYLQKYGWI